MVQQQLPLTEHSARYTSQRSHLLAPGSFTTTLPLPGNCARRGPVAGADPLNSPAMEPAFTPSSPSCFPLYHQEF